MVCKYELVFLRKSDLFKPGFNKVFAMFQAVIKIIEYYCSLMRIRICVNVLDN